MLCLLVLAFFITGTQPKAGTGLKMQTVRLFKVTLLGMYRSDQQAQSPLLLNTGSYFQDMLMIVPVVTRLQNRNPTLGNEKGWGKGVN